MKKFLALIFFTFSALCSYAQLFTKIKHVDKFDDVVKEETRKTLITRTDSTFVIEEKGRQPVVYYILNIMKEGTHGSKDDVVNLVGNVYGYETTWCLVRYDELGNYKDVYYSYILDPSDDNMKRVSSFWIFAVHRTITTQFAGIYQNELFWLQDDLNANKLGKDINRIIYSK